MACRQVTPYKAPSKEGALPLYKILATAWSPRHLKCLKQTKKDQLKDWFFYLVRSAALPHPQEDGEEGHQGEADQDGKGDGEAGDAGVAAAFFAEGGRGYSDGGKEGNGDGLAYFQGDRKSVV